MCKKYNCVCRLCSLAQHAKQEVEDSTSLKKSIKPEPATSEEEEGADTKLSASADNVDVKPSQSESSPLI